MNDDTKNTQAVMLREILTGFQRSRVLLTAYELGIFSSIGVKGSTSAEIASKTGSDRRATDRLLNALCAMGLLIKKGERFGHSDASRAYLAPESPEHLSGIMHMNTLWERWSDLTQAVKRGHADAGKVDSWDEEDIRSFIAAMNDRAKSQAPVIAEMIDCEGMEKILDVGGGSAAFSIAFAKRYPGLRTVVFDLPSVVALTQAYIAGEGLSDVIGTVPGDYDHDELGNGYDMIFFSAIVHSNSEEQNRILVEKCRRALKPGGRIAIVDFIMDESRTNPKAGAMFALNMLVATRYGDTFTASEMTRWVEDAGFGEVLIRETPFGTSILTAALKG